MTSVIVKSIKGTYGTDVILLSDDFIYGLFWKYPAYEVRGIFGAFKDIEPIIIEKTTPEEDQRKICAAVKSIEEQHRERERREAELQRLADGCK